MLLVQDVRLDVANIKVNVGWRDAAGSHSHRLCSSEVVIDGGVDLDGRVDVEQRLGLRSGDGARDHKISRACIEEGIQVGRTRQRGCAQINRGVRKVNTVRQVGFDDLLRLSKTQGQASELDVTTRNLHATTGSGCGGVDGVTESSVADGGQGVGNSLGISGQGRRIKLNGEPIGIDETSA